MENETISWQDLVRLHVSMFRTFAGVGNISDALRHLAEIDQVVAAAVELKHLPKETHLDVTTIGKQVRPLIVLRQEHRAAAIIGRALQQAGVFSRELSHIPYANCDAA